MVEIKKWLIDYLMDNNSDTFSNVERMVQILNYEEFRWGMLASVTDGDLIVKARFTKKDINDFRHEDSQLQFDNVIVTLTEYCYDVRYEKENLKPVLTIKKSHFVGIMKGLKFKNLRDWSLCDDTKSILIYGLIRTLKKNNILIRKSEDDCTQVPTDKKEENNIAQELISQKSNNAEKSQINDHILKVDIFMDEINNCSNIHYSVEIHSQKLDDIDYAKINRSMANEKFNNDVDCALILEGCLAESMNKFDLKLFKPVKTSSQKNQHNHDNGCRDNSFEENRLNADGKIEIISQINSKDDEIKIIDNKDEDNYFEENSENMIVDSDKCNKSVMLGNSSLLNMLINGLGNTDNINKSNNFNNNELWKDCGLDGHNSDDLNLSCIKATDAVADTNDEMGTAAIKNIASSDADIKLNDNRGEGTELLIYTSCKTKICPNHNGYGKLKDFKSSKLKCFESKANILDNNKRNYEVANNYNRLSECKNDSNGVVTLNNTQTDFTKITKEKVFKSSKKKKVPTATLR